MDWKRKLTSRKFWMATSAFVFGIVLAINGSAEVAETISGCVVSAVSAIAYIIGEGIADGKGGDKGGS